MMIYAKFESLVLYDIKALLYLQEARGCKKDRPPPALIPLKKGAGRVSQTSGNWHKNPVCPAKVVGCRPPFIMFFFSFLKII